MVANLLAYEELWGALSLDVAYAEASCIGQCTGCMCNCRCSCRESRETDLEWEII